MLHFFGWLRGRAQRRQKKKSVKLKVRQPRPPRYSRLFARSEVPGPDASITWDRRAAADNTSGKTLPHNNHN